MDQPVEEEEHEPSESDGLHRSLTLYLREIRKIPLLTAEGEKELCNRIAEGDAEAERKLVESNLRLVVEIVKKFRGYGADFYDLIQAGNIGLMRSAKTYKAAIGRFTTYAVPWIERYAQRELVNNGRTVRVSSYIWDISARIRKLDLPDDTPEEIAKALQVSLKSVKRAQVALKTSISLDAPVTGAEDLSPYGCTPGKTEDLDQLIDDVVSFEYVRAALASVLDAREQDILSRRFGMTDEDPQSLQVIAERYHLSKERVRQVEAEALQKLKRYFLRQQNFAPQKKALLEVVNV